MDWFLVGFQWLFHHVLSLISSDLRILRSFTIFYKRLIIIYRFSAKHLIGVHHFGALVLLFSFHRQIPLTNGIEIFTYTWMAQIYGHCTWILHTWSTKKRVRWDFQYVLFVLKFELDIETNKSSTSIRKLDCFLLNFSGSVDLTYRCHIRFLHACSFSIGGCWSTLGSRWVFSAQRMPLINPAAMSESTREEGRILPWRKEEEIILKIVLV